MRRGLGPSLGAANFDRRRGSLAGSMKLQLIAILACVSSAICFAAVHFAESGDENAFARQLHGEWVRCAPDYYPQPRVTNGIFLFEAVTFRTNGVAEWKKSAVRGTGRYSVKFERPPARGASTFARISLTAEDGLRRPGRASGRQSV